jgi:ankyrin repeat protein
MAAAISGHANVVQALVDHGSDLTVVNGNGNTVLKSALDQGRPHIVYILLKALGGPDYPQDSLALNMAMAKSTEDVKSLMTSAGLSQPTCSSDDATRRFMYSDIIDEILHKGGDVIQPHALSAMMDAALHEGGSIMVASLLSHGFGPSQFLSNGKTPIHVAVAWEDFALVELLLERSADPSIMSRNLEGQKYTPLDQALFNFNSHEMKDTLIIDSLLATRKCKLMAGPDIHSTAFSYVLSHYTTWPNDAGMTMTSTMLAYAEDIHADRSDDGSTLLHAAIYHGRTDIIDVLLCKGANINAADHLGRTPFYLECQRSTRLFRFLLNRTADPHVKGPDGQSSLHVAAGAGKPEIINFLLTLDLDINIEDANGYTPLSWALILGQENAVLHLLYRAAKLPTKKFRRGRTMLHVAASLGMLRFTKLLLANKSVELDVNAKDDMGWTPLALACRKGTKELVSALLNAGAETEASPRNTEDRPLHLALRAGNVDVAEILLTHGADVTVRGEQGQTPLHLAAQLTNSHIIQLLLIHNPEISALDVLGRIPLSLCTNPDTANILIGFGAAVNHVDNQGWTPSHFAVESENLEMFRVLVRNEADVDARTLDDGMSVTERIEWVEDEDVRWEMEEVLRDET